MGLLSKGTPLDWPETLAVKDHVKESGVRQFIRVFLEHQYRQNDPFLWGDEVEYIVLRHMRPKHHGDDDKHGDQNGNSALNGISHECSTDCRFAALLNAEATLIPLLTLCDKSKVGRWHVEQSGFMLESTPYSPYSGSDPSSLSSVEASMRDRRRLIQEILQSDDIVVTMGNFPRLGCKDSMVLDLGEQGTVEPSTDTLDEAIHGLLFTNHISKSLYLPDAVFSSHPRFITVGKNLNSRRGSVAQIRVPKAVLSGTEGNIQDEIDMDAMSFGMGCTCLQVTIQAANLQQARRLFDAMVPLAPFLMAVTASTAIFRGILSDRDCRWDVIAASVDDRTRQERAQPHSRSRYSGIARYLDVNQPHWASDLTLSFDQYTYDRLTEKGIDHQLSLHVATLFTRDPLVVYKELVDQNDQISTDHWENIQSTNWQSVRFKPPPPPSDDEVSFEYTEGSGRPMSTGWRIEVRTMENQLDDFSNASFAVFVVLLARGMLTSDEVTFYTPISLVDENLRKAQFNDACHREKFCYPASIRESLGYFKAMTIDEIFNGPDGLVAIARHGLESILEGKSYEPAQRTRLEDYISFVSERASGRLLTPAQWIRKFVQSHPEYQNDGLVTPAISHDLVMTVDQIGKSLIRPSALFGSK